MVAASFYDVCVTATERDEAYDIDLETDDDVHADPTAEEIAGGGATRGLAWLLTIGGALGLVAAFTLTYDKFKITADPSFQPSCNFNPLLSCGSIMQTEQASAFGFPNSFMGLIGFSMVLTIGVLLVARVRLPAPVWLLFNLGALTGVLFVLWLIYQSLYQINKLCPWCMVVWAVTIPIFLYTTLRNLQAHAPDNGLVRFLTNWHALVLSLCYLAVVALALVRFWDQWLLMVGIT